MKIRFTSPIVVGALAAIAAVAVTALLVNIFTRQQEARNPFYRIRAAKPRLGLRR